METLFEQRLCVVTQVQTLELSDFYVSYMFDVFLHREKLMFVEINCLHFLAIFSKNVDLVS